ncbi:diaminopimelate decarboxylase [Micromonospora sp. NPDC005173]|uniref:diaminopimelate decarboxylase n=1 Tax=Micromonospora sp. NPDC005173 TaxID=3157165 RepID=UPI0033BE1297
MTLLDAIPPSRASLPPRLPVHLWPATTRCESGGIRMGGVALTDIAEEFGTPTYVLDTEDVRARCREYAAAFGAANVAYAAKALACRAVLRWIEREGLALSVCSAGQLAAAAAVGFPADRIILHGDAKTPDDLDRALEYGVGTIVIESASEVARLAALARGRQRVLLRVLPGANRFGLDAAAALPAGPDGDRFGLPAGDQLAETLRRIADQPTLDLVGLDFYLGSQVAGFGGYERAIDQLVSIIGHAAREHGIALREINLGGGHAVPGTEAEAEFALTAFASRVRAVLHIACERYGVPMPRLVVTPGRAIVARAGVALYRVLAVRRDVDGHQLVAVDGGLSDNPRPAMYGARYTVALAGRASRHTTRPTTVVGRHDEASDVIVRDAQLPGDMRPGDLLAVPGSGAYHVPLASNYNLVPRPPVIAVHYGDAWPVMRRETIEDILARDLDREGGEQAECGQGGQAPGRRQQEERHADGG